MIRRELIGLTDQQRIFVLAIGRGADRARAAQEAGYSAPVQESARLLHSPKVLAAVEAEIRHRLAMDWAPEAWHFLTKVMRDEKFAGGIRVDAAKYILQVAGYVPAKPQEAADPANRDPAEMSVDELRGMVEQLEGEIAGRAQVVEPNALDSEPDAHPGEDQLADLIG